MTSIPMLIVRKDKCDACYGDNFCNHVMKGSIVMDIPHKATAMSSKGAYVGQWEGKSIVVKTGAGTDRFMMFDRYSCNTVFQTPDCDVTSSISNISNIDIDIIRNLQVKIHGRPLPFSYCSSNDLLNELVAGYSRYPINRATNFLFTSLVINPEFAFLNFFTKNHNLPFPRNYGSCGRVSIIERNGSPLETFLDNPFKERAEIAFHILKSLKSLINDQDRWSLSYLDLSYENILYNEKSKSILFTESGNLVISQKINYDWTALGLCNENCMSKEAIYKILENQNCASFTYQAAHSMFATVCAQILTDSNDIRKKFGNKLLGETIPKGLLHSSTDDVSKSLQELLSQCVTESLVNGRMNAVKKLMAILKNIINST
ncbi:DgyrCDS12066 [Dimorphilus gyrociliatus]|uniref:DgyrCDS12066 n=1 Tax=Dimorphilus gyrociliatus TaxID=2664684 RepID=A0A7I8W6L7_9ANNE|nr:DgyrCDS12066 [Dimorphilus gyrociliatus]